MQQENHWNLEKCQLLIKNLCREGEFDSTSFDGLTLNMFSDFLFFSEQNNALQAEKLLLDVESMHYPLTAYFCNSSHNTYLTGHQLKGLSHTEMYEKCLLDGYRCVELDCWNGERGEPKITHGNTLTSDISYEATIEVISKTAFVSSPYPIILSYEMHCNKVQQEKVAKIMLKYFGRENIFILPQEITDKKKASSLSNPEDWYNFPSPE